MEETNLHSEDGKKRLYPRLIDTHPVSHARLVEYLKDTSGLPESTITGVLSILGERMSYLMGLGYSVKIDGLGRFTPTLGLKAGKEREESEETTTDEHGRPIPVHRNATSIEVNNISFRPDKDFLHDVNCNIDLERSPYHKTIRPSQCPYTEEQRKQMLIQYLNVHPFITCSEYMSLTSQKRTAATTELKRFSDDPTVPVTPSGRGSHRVYVLEG